MKIISLSSLLFALTATSAAAFAPPTGLQTRGFTTHIAAKLDMEETTNRGTKKGTLVPSVLAAAFVASSIVFGTDLAPAFAEMDQTSHMLDFGSTETLAARSGGRSGGRASSGGNSRSYRSSAPAPSRSTYRSYSSTTYVAPPPVVVTPSYGLGFGYNPLGGFGTGYALGTLGNIGNSMEDYRQEREIQQSRAELEQARMREAELEGRLRALEQQNQKAAPAPLAPAAP